MMDYDAKAKWVLNPLINRMILMDQYTKILLSIITFCAVLVTMVIVGSAIVHDHDDGHDYYCLLYTSPSPRDRTRSRMPSSA